MASLHSRVGFSFFPLCLLWKTPLTVFLIMGVAGWGLGHAAMWRPYQGTKGRLATQPAYQLVPLIVLFSVYWIVAIRSDLNIGHRHILPTYPPMFIFAGAAGLWFPVADRWRVQRRTATGATLESAVPLVPSRPRFASVARGLTIAAFILGVVETIGFWPHYLAYFNIVAGGPRHGYRRLVDSSLDWGQDLSELKRWLDAHPVDSRDPRRVYLSYFGTAVPCNVRYPGPSTSHVLSQMGWVASMAADRRRVLHQRSLLQSVYIVPFFGRWNEKYENYYQGLQSHRAI